MQRRLFTIGSLFLLLFSLALPAFGQRTRDNPERLQPAVLQQIDELLAEKEGRTPAQRKIDSQLLYTLKARRGQRITAHVESLSTFVETDVDGMTIVDITAIVTPELLDGLRATGAHVLSSYPAYNSVRAAVELESVETIAAMPQVLFIQPKQEAMTSRPVDEGERMRGVATDLPTTFAERAARVREQLAAALPLVAASKTKLRAGADVGSKNSEGDVAHRADMARTTFGINGAGVKIGVLSDGVTNLAASQALGDLGPVTVLPGQTGSGDEGTAMLEIVHDLAPGANLYFATAFTSLVSFAQNIRDLRTAGCDIIIDDVFYFVETPFQDGQLTPSNTNGGQVIQAVNDVTAAGGMYFSSAGNSGNLNDGTAGVWEGDFVDGGPTGSPLPSGGRVHNFGGQNFDLLTVASTGPIGLYWSDPLGGSSNDYDLFRLNAAGTAIAASSTNIQSGTQDPYEQISQSTTNPRIVIVKKNAAQPRFLHLNTNRGRLSIATAGQTHGHSHAASAFGCAATPASAAFPGSFNPANTVETFSSDGPRRVFFQPNGTPYTPGNVSATGGIVRQKPDITAADGVSVTGVGGFASPFFGTSAAAPHAGAIAGLLKSANGALTPAQIRTALTSSAVDIEAFGVDRDSGAGIILALEAGNALGLPGLPNPEIAAFSAAEAPGNGNGSIEAGEGATLFVTIKNSGATAASNLVATLTTSTPGIVIASPNVRSYGALPIGASVTNAVPYKFFLQPSVPCPQTIVFTLTVTTPELPSPRALPLSVATGLPKTLIASTVDATPPAAGAGFTAVTGLQNARIFRDGVPSVCGPPKAFPGVTGTGTRQFDAYSFHTCPGSTPACVTVRLTAPVGANPQLFVAAYQGSFNPANLGQNYLADAGASNTAGSPFGFNVTVAPGSTLVVVVAEVNAGFGPYNYQLSVDGCITASCPTPNNPPVALAHNVTVSAGATCTANASVDNGSFDPDGDPLTLTQSPAGPYALGTTAVQLTVTDPKGAFAQANANVTVADTTPPAISCPADITVSNATGTCSASVSVGAATATDNCSPTVSIGGVRSDGQPLSALYPVGTTTIVWTATDAAGNSSNCSQKITVKDTETPSLTVPGPIVVEFASDAGAAVGFTVTSADNCPGVSHACTPPSGSVFPIGVTAVTCVATDLAGNSTTKTFTVTVLGARGVKTDVLSDLTALRATITDKQDGDKLDMAIQDLTQSLAASLWTDQTHVADAAVFQHEKDCVNVLRNLIKNHNSTIADATLQGLIGRIVSADRLLAGVAIADAAAGGADVSKALAERAAGDADVAGGNYESGIEHYRNAWSQARK